MKTATGVCFDLPTSKDPGKKGHRFLDLSGCVLFIGIDYRGGGFDVLVTDADEAEDEEYEDDDGNDDQWDPGDERFFCAGGR